MNGGSEMDIDELPRRKLMSSSPSVSIVRKNGCDYIGRVGDGESSDRTIDKRWKNEGMSSSACIFQGVIADADSGKSVGDEGERFQPLGFTFSSATATVSGSVTGRKRVRLHGKEKSESGDAGLVPRKIRSAINKHKKQLVSPPQAQADAKKKHHMTSDPIQVPFGSDLMNSNDSLLLDSITEDEKEVVEALFKLSSLIVLQPANKIELKETIDFKANGKTSPTPSEGQVLKDKDHRLTCNESGAQVLLSTTEKLVKETMDSEVAVKAEPVLYIESQTSKPVTNKPHQNDCQTTLLLSKKDNQDTSNISKNAVNSPTFMRISDDHCSEKRITQTVQSDTLPIGSAQVSCEVQAVKYVENIEELVSTKASSYEPNAPCTAKGQLELEIGHSPVMNSSRQIPCGSDLPSRKPPQRALGVTESWKKCIIHMNICNLIKDHQKNEKLQQMPLTSDRSKSSGETKLTINTKCETTGAPNCFVNLTTGATTGCSIQKNTSETNLIKLENSMKPPAVSSGTHVQPKQTHDFLSLSTSTGVVTSGNSPTLLGQLPSPLLHPQAPHHSIMHLPLPHIPYPFPPASASVAMQQLHVPKYAGNSFYAPHMANIVGTSRLQQQYQQQQQMWEAHLSNYRQQIGVQLTQNGRVQDPFLCLNNQISPYALTNLHGLSYHHIPSAQPQHMLAGSSVPSGNKIQQHQLNGTHNSGGLQRGPSQLQLLCNVQR